MNDLISRQAAIAYSISGMTREIDGEKWIRVSEVRESIKTMPTAERVGKWIRHPEVKNIYGGVYIECSECREKYVVQYVEDEKFCPNCGARMKGEEDEF